MNNIRTLLLSVLLTAACCAQTPQPDPYQQVSDALIGQSLYSCLDAEFQNVKSAKGDYIHGYQLKYAFLAMDELAIRHVVVTRLPNQSGARVTISVERKLDGKTADVVTWIEPPDFTIDRILAAVAKDGNLKVRPLSAANRVEIGMSRSDVYCELGYPDQTNGDALAGDQLVYENGRLLVYISPTTDRVEDVQTTE